MSGGGGGGASPQCHIGEQLNETTRTSTRQGDQRYHRAAAQEGEKKCKEEKYTNEMLQRRETKEASLQVAE